MGLQGWAVEHEDSCWLRVDLRFPAAHAPDRGAGHAFHTGAGHSGARLADDRARRDDLALPRPLWQLVQPSGRAGRPRPPVGGRHGARFGPARHRGTRGRPACGRGPAGGDAHLPAGQPLLRNGPSVRHCVEALCRDGTGMGARPGHLRLRPQPHHLRLPPRPPDQDGVGRLHRGHRRLPRLRPPGRHVLPLHEHPGALLHGLSR